tara:strand:- start:102 stop:365 length:264 start_codon:yes stop_codon:yes gene_type:complete
MKKKFLIIMLAMGSLAFSQTQCNGLTKDSVQCKNTTKSISELCYLHNENYVKKTEVTSVVCSGTTGSGRNCKNKTKHESGRCHHHRN